MEFASEVSEYITADIVSHWVAANSCFTRRKPEADLENANTSIIIVNIDSFSILLKYLKNLIRYTSENNFI